MKIMDDSNLLSIKEFAQKLGIHWQTVRNYINEGKIKSVKIGRVVRIPLDEINRLTQATQEEKKEVEIRLWIKDVPELEDRLRKIGARLTNHSHVIDSYYCDRSVSSIAEKDKAFESAFGYGLRIRQIDNDYSERFFCTLEVKKLAGPTYMDHSNCLEAEIDLT
jgi:excisionase family DNA binding protein